MLVSQALPSSNSTPTYTLAWAWSAPPGSFPPRHRLGRKPMLSWCCLQVAVAGAGATFAPNFLIYCSLRFLSAFGHAGIIIVLSTLSESLAQAPRVWGGARRDEPSPACLHGLAVAEWTTTRRRAVTMTILGCTYSTGQMAVAGLAFILRDWQDLQLAVSVPFLAFCFISWSVWPGASSSGRYGKGGPCLPLPKGQWLESDPPWGQPLATLGAASARGLWLPASLVRHPSAGTALAPGRKKIFSDVKKKIVTFCQKLKLRRCFKTKMNRISTFSRKWGVPGVPGQSLARIHCKLCPSSTLAPSPPTSLSPSCHLASKSVRTNVGYETRSLSLWFWCCKIP